MSHSHSRYTFRAEQTCLCDSIGLNLTDMGGVICGFAPGEEAPELTALTHSRSGQRTERSPNFRSYSPDHQL